MTLARTLGLARLRWIAALGAFPRLICAGREVSPLQFSEFVGMFNMLDVHHFCGNEGCLFTGESTADCDPVLMATVAIGVFWMVVNRFRFDIFPQGILSFYLHDGPLCMQILSCCYFPCSCIERYLHLLIQLIIEFYSIPHTISIRLQSAE